ncbi:Endonuclease-reverse transcriptase [Popillia japonica]|uniref:Endonuclease-reverse transcriptase n=1 Tax=Popillia japonica TaxID=7064 RepID=A0AAW1KGK7_POPJA
MAEIRKLAEELRLDILCIQEPYAYQGFIPGMPIDARTVMYGDRPKIATVIFNCGITATKLDHLSDSHSIVTEIHTPIGRWVLLNQYYQFEDPIDLHLRKTRMVFMMYSDVPVVLMADANAKSGLWNSPVTDAKGEELELLIQELGLELENQPGSAPI